jgi:hypothetical protein
VPEELFSLTRGGFKGEHAPSGSNLLRSEQSVETMMRTDVYHDHTGLQKILDKRALRVFETSENYGNPTKIVFREPPCSER